ncbi:MAG: transposase zinc-binding domain-containing protein [Sandaracinaceae bacterium]|nr:transposase zinc-binding domain-containing protein [Sandaracinaceae bacterium]
MPARADGYARRRPEDTLLYALVREHWPRFLERAEEQGGLPRFVVRDFDEYLRCGRLEHGVVRLACRRCGHELLVRFACKRRGFCPSCLGRRMSDVAAHLVDEVLPDVPIRQWVCSLPWALRYLLAYDRRLCAAALAAFVGAVTRSLRWRATRQLGLRSVEDAFVGAVTFIQRSDSALRLNVPARMACHASHEHRHTLALDGVYVRDLEGALVFHALPPPSGDEVADVAARAHAALLGVLERHGRSLEFTNRPTRSSTSSRCSPRATPRPLRFSSAP